MSFSVFDNTSGVVDVITILLQLFCIVFLYLSIFTGILTGFSSSTTLQYDLLHMVFYILVGLVIFIIGLFFIHSESFRTNLAPYMIFIYGLVAFQILFLVIYYPVKYYLNKLNLKDIIYGSFLGISTGTVLGGFASYIIFILYGITLLTHFFHFIVKTTQEIFGFKNEFFADSTLQNRVFITLFSFLSLALLIYLYLYIGNVVNNQTTDSYAYYVILGVLLFGIIGICTYIFTSNNLLETISENRKLVLRLVLFSCFVFFLYRTYTSYNVGNYFKGIDTFFTISIVLVALAIVFILFRNTLNQWGEGNGLLALFINIMFYIPCILIDGVNYMRNEIKMTSTPIFILFIIEILLIIAYLMVPYFKSRIMNKDAVILLPGGLYLKHQSSLGNNDMYKINGMSTSTFKNDNKDASSYRKNYAFSFWIYVNTQQHKPNRIEPLNETPIFDFGNKPRLSYVSNADRTLTENGDSVLNDTFAVQFTNTTDQTINNKMLFSVGKQKWHYIVFNYYADKAELFIDGNLERSYEFHEHIPTIDPGDVVKVGYDGKSETGLSGSGLSGAIYNIKYHKDNLAPKNIARNYELLKFSNPPRD